MSNGSGSLADQVASSTLKYRTQTQSLDAMLREIGLESGTLNGLTDGLITEQVPADTTPRRPSNREQTVSSPGGPVYRGCPPSQAQASKSLTVSAVWAQAKARQFSSVIAESTGVSAA